jgi:type IV secretory pathway VirB10-like protein
MNLRNRLATTALASALALTLSACDDGGSPSTPSTPPPNQAGENSDIHNQLLDVIRTKPKEGGELAVDPERLRITVEAGERGRASTLLRNVGDEPVVLAEVEPLILTESLDISNRGCSAGMVLEPQQGCEVRVTWTDLDGRDIATGILIRSDARKTPEVSVPLQVSVQDPPPAEPETCAAKTVKLCGSSRVVPELVYGATADISAGQSRQRTYVCTRDAGLQIQRESGVCETAAPVARTAPDTTATARLIERARAMRLGRGIGSADSDTAIASVAGSRSLPPREQLTEEPGYDRSLFAGVDTSLPVDRSRILTEDRVIKAVLETPFSSAMCTRVVAQVESHVYAPEGTQILIPAGTRFVGECAEFASGVTGGRAQINWRRFITPTGVSAALNARAADANGLGGVPGTVNKRWLDRYGIPLVFSAVNALVTAVGSDGVQVETNAETGATTEERSARSLATEQFTNDAQALGDRLASELQEVKEVMTVPAGTRLDIVLSQDLYFTSPYEVVNLDGELYRIAETEGIAGTLRPNSGIDDYAKRVEEINDGYGGGVRKIFDIDGREYRLEQRPDAPAAPGQGAGGQ